MRRPTPPRPMYEAAGDALPGRRRALLVTYHFPPGQAAGALRWQKLVELGAERGWGFDVLTLDGADVGSPDPRRLEALPPGTRVFGVPDPPRFVERLEHALWLGVQRLRTVRARLDSGPVDRAPDPAAGAAAKASPPAAPSRPGSLAREEVGFLPLEPRSLWRAYQAWVELARGAAWARRAEALGRDLMLDAEYAVVVSSGPPEMAHVGAARLARRAGLPHVLDFRDPWSLRERLPEHLASPIWYASARRHERRLAGRAAAIIMNTESAREAMQAAHPDRADRIVAIPNGCDDDPLPGAERGARFVLAYAGAIYLDRSPAVLFRAAARLIRDRRLSPSDFGIEFMGYIDPLLPIEELAREAGIWSHVRIHPPGNRSEAATFLARASMLLNLPQDSRMAIPSKIFEYMRFPAFLLALEEPGSATERLLRDTGADVAAPQDEAGIARILETRYASWTRGLRPTPIADDPRFGRTARAGELFSLLDRVAARDAAWRTSRTGAMKSARGERTQDESAR